MAKQKVYTQQDMMRRIRPVRKMANLFAPRFLKKGTASAGKEEYLNTQVGAVRVLTYKMEDPRILPLFINIHGSGFILGNAEMDDSWMEKLSEMTDIKIISVDYCLAPENPFPASLEQCYAVAKYAQKHAQELGIDANHIAWGGHSAGGNFSAAMCLLNAKRRELNPCCVILDYPPLDIYTPAKQKPRGTLPVFVSNFFDPCYCPNPEERKNPLISPIYADPSDLASFPPTLVITASRDSLCAEGEKFCDLLRAAKVCVTHKRFDAGHGFNLKEGKLTDDSWQLMSSYLKQHFA